MKDYKETINTKMVSNCCGANPISELCDQNTGICAACFEGAEFHDESEPQIFTSFFDELEKVYQESSNEETNWLDKLI